ncbi:MAG: CRISPR-associated endoribonuclease Cas6 [Rhabdochlamydiaceae bacterium]
MRLLIHLDTREDAPYENDYHYHLQAGVYSLIREGGLEQVHQKQGYKFFCFSNIFPFGDYLKGSERSLLVSSPDPTIIEAIARSSALKAKNNEPLFVGRLQFAVTSVSKPFRIGARSSEVIVRSATPIVMRIPRARYEEYELKPKVDYEYTFWRNTLPLEAFVKQLVDNIEKKWNEFSTQHTVATNRGNDPLSEPEKLMPEVLYYRFLKMVSKPITLRQERQMIIGSMWELSFAPQTLLEQRVLEFALDCGFGERNSLGFGFMNVQ